MPDWWSAITGPAPTPAAGPPPGSPTAATGRESPAEVEQYIRTASTARGIDPEVALRVVKSEGGLEPNRRGTFKTGSSWGPLQLHWGGPGYEQYGNVAGMGNSFTAQTGFQPGDPTAWKSATDYALDAAAKSGWGAWYGARNQGITGYQGITRGAAPAVAPAAAAAPPPAASPVAARGGPEWWGAIAAPTAAPRTAAAVPSASASGQTPRSDLPPDQVAKQSIAANWALSQLGSKDYYNLCQRFIEQAYGTGGQFGSAAAAGKALFKTANPAEADPGDLIFFKPDASNGFAGHAAIYLGNGEMVGATNGGITRDRIDSPYWSKLLVGFGDPPAAWKGRSGGSTAALEKGTGQLLQQAAPARAAWMSAV
jgi:cell wall-associated NlpC family hydrolase